MAIRSGQARNAAQVPDQAKKSKCTNSNDLRWSAIRNTVAVPGTRYTAGVQPLLPRIIAHRGASACEPENSLAAFRHAIELGADGIELDVHSTVDGGLIVHHDFEIPGLGPIGGLPVDRVRAHRLPNGEPVPLLQEALEAIGGHEVWVEVKSLAPQFDGALLALLAGGPAPHRYAVHGFDHRDIARLGAAQAGLERGVLSTSYPLDPISPVRAAGAATLWQEHHLVDRELVDRMHSAGCAVIAWTVDGRRDAARLAALGVDGLCGNSPDEILAALGR
jgi:glycerophosphoryl diester phosphodiesterase